MSIHEVIEKSPLIQGYKAEAAWDDTRRHTLRWLTRRFGPMPEYVPTFMVAIMDQEALDYLHDFAIECPNRETFLTAMAKILA